MAFYDPVMVEVNVLLVDRNANSLLQTCNLLQINSYKVTAVQETTTASTMLVQACPKFDVVMIDVNSSDVEAYKLLHVAVQMRTTVILMSDYANPTLAKCAIEDGAFMFLKKPLTMDVLMYLWQHVLREKTRIIEQKGKFIEKRLENNLTANYMDTIGYGPVDRRSKGIRIEENIDSESANSERLARRPKICTEWTAELHEQFMEAVRYLGEGRCFPKDIMELMNVPGLTRMQVASHLQFVEFGTLPCKFLCHNTADRLLQKCRIGWQPPEERKPRRKGSKSSTSSSSGTVSSSKPKNKKYGLFPRQIRGLQPKEKENQNQYHVQSQFQVLDQSGSSDNMGSSAPPPGIMYNIQGAFDSPASANSASNENSGEQVAENSNVVVLDKGFQGFNMNSLELGIDNDVDVRGINFNMQDMVWNQVEPEQAANCDAEIFWNSWISSFAKDQ